MNKVLYKHIIEKLQDITLNDKAIVVLKGVPLNTITQDIINIEPEKILLNSLSYFIELQKSGRKFIIYEEYLLMKSFILTQYETVYILNNNLYLNLVPIDATYSEKVKEGLLIHFSDSENDYDETVIGDNSIREIINLYDGVIEHKGMLMGTYCENEAEDELKIQTVNLFKEVLYEIQSIADTGEISNVIDVQHESDYVDLVRMTYECPAEINIRTSNFEGDTDRLKSHISMLGRYWSDYTHLHFLQIPAVKDTFEHRKEYTDILKKYWGYDKFRNFSVYDLDSLEKGEKLVKKVSQEQIISDIVQQVENCDEKDKEYRDVFVTAPTGAGKSVIFQVPAIYLAEKYELFTIVISPLIGLMNDQVNGLEKRNYKYAKTINSDISPIVKEEVLNDVGEGNIHILYISPETLLARSDVEQLIGDRTIGMIVIDEAHIVTTWGKQFRPDYWYLGDHISKLRRSQLKRKGRSFVIATFTATAIYHGVEDMYEETRNSLHMIDPITYLGYVKRNDITIRIEKMNKKNGERHEYEFDKLKMLENIIKRAMITGKKTLIYFPTVTLIDKCYEYFENIHMVQNIVKYYGPLDKDTKEENYRMFMDGQKLVMFATKAFGMGIDIDDIELVAHYAPTGNVCDYVQEIGRAARRQDIKGEAYYKYDKHDFKYINRLHGLSSIKKYQLIEVVKKLLELYKINREKNHGNKLTKRMNAMLVDAENFTYIFDNPVSDSDDNINRVKTTLLILQKDFEAKIGFSPINVRPIPLFATGYFAIDPRTQKRLNRKYKDCCHEVYEDKHICSVNLQNIWNKDYKDRSFPQFKYMLYTKSNELSFNAEYTLQSALCVTIKFADDFISKFTRIWGCLKKVAIDGSVSQEYISLNKFIDALEKKCGIRKYKAQAICEVMMISMNTYRQHFMRGSHAISMRRELKNGDVKYLFKPAVNSYFNWVEKGFKQIADETEEDKLYIINTSENKAKSYNTVLGILEALDVLTFEMLGGANSQLYIYVNQERNLINIKNNPKAYKNRLLDMVSQRHLISVKMLTYIYENNFTSEEIWNIIEDYFLGRIPEKVKESCRKADPSIVFPNY